MITMYGIEIIGKNFEIKNLFITNIIGGESKMSRYFKIIEIDEDTYIDATGEDLGGWVQSVIPTRDAVYVALDDSCEEEISVSVNSFDEE